MRVSFVRCGVCVCMCGGGAECACEQTGVKSDAAAANLIRSNVSAEHGAHSVGLATRQKGGRVRVEGKHLTRRKKSMREGKRVKESERERDKSKIER